MSRTSGAERLVRLVSRVTVLVWIAGALAWSALGPVAALPQALASIEAVPLPVEPPPATATAPEPPPETRTAQAEPDARTDPTSTTTPEARRIGADEIAEGARLLTAGAFPALSSSYTGFGSFRAYARAMVALGARFVVVRERRIVAAIDFESGALAAFEGAAAFSPRARDYSGEDGLRALSRRAREAHGPGAEVMLLVPRELDAALFGGIAGVLRERGETHAGYREIRGSYARTPSGDVVLRIDAGVRRDGSRVPFDLVFDLTEIARS